MAEAYAKSVIRNHNFTSRGLMAYEGMPMSENAMEALRTYGIPCGEHTSRLINNDDIENADLILTMSGSHKRALEAAAGDKVFTLKEYTLGEKSDIADPFGGDTDTYINCLDEIILCVKALKEKLK